MRKLLFKKRVDGGELKCTLEECEDGGVYVTGDEFELIVEFTDDAVKEATRQVLEAGYQPVCSE